MNNLVASRPETANKFHWRLPLLAVAFVIISLIGSFGQTVFLELLG
jgi:hypothetical protein